MVNNTIYVFRKHLTVQGPRSGRGCGGGGPLAPGVFPIVGGKGFSSYSVKGSDWRSGIF